LRQEFEPRFGRNFSEVRLHTDTKAARLAASIDARAFTYGRNIAFNTSEFEPETKRGRKLLAHELTHVAQQQRAGAVTVQREQMPSGGEQVEATDADRRMFIEETIRAWESSVRWLGLENTTDSRERFDGMIDNWYLMVVDRERMIERDLDGPPALQREMRAAYTGAIRALISKFAASGGSSETTLYRVNRGRIPMWAWQTPHHSEDFITTPVPQGVQADVLSGDVHPGPFPAGQRR